MAEYKFWKKFGSRKFISAILGAIVGVVGDSVGVPQIAINWVLGILATYIAGETAVDVVRNGSFRKPGA